MEAAEAVVTALTPEQFAELMDLLIHIETLLNTMLTFIVAYFVWIVISTLFNFLWHWFFAGA